MKFIKSCILSVVVCGSETWTLGKHEERVVNGFETSCWREIINRKETVRITNYF
jgi:hypothetical protein